MAWTDNLPTVRGKLLLNEPLGPYTWFRVGGAADALFIPADAEDLADFLKAQASQSAEAVATKLVARATETFQAQDRVARERMEAFSTQHPELGKENCHLAFGQPRQEIHRMASEHGCDLIVTGSHGRHGLALLLGSTSNDLLHAAPCDVLAVHLKKPE